MIRFYATGEDFLKENKSILDENILDTSFFLWNAKHIHEINAKNYIFKVINGNSYLLVMQYYPYNLLLYGDSSLCKEAVTVFCDYNLYFSKILAAKELNLEFLKCYEDRMSGIHQINLSMDIMYARQCKEVDTSCVKKCTLEDVNELAMLTLSFFKEATNESKELEDYKRMVYDTIQNYYCIRQNNKIISIAKKTKDEEKMCCTSSVYTLPEYRGQGFSKKVVTKITEDILKENKIPYLYVDKKNPISNHLYQSIGYGYGNAKYEIKYFPGKIKRLVLAGGCFWCLANSYYNNPGVIQVTSGYAGGTEFMPTYELVKAGNSGHREAIMIEYDSEKTSASKLLNLYFSVIDPFDAGGQFIDRGENYTCAIFTDDTEEREYASSIISNLETKFKKKVYVSLCPDTIFYKAEEYHQDYGLKHPKQMEEELIQSGRIKK